MHRIAPKKFKEAPEISKKVPERPREAPESTREAPGRPEKPEKPEKPRETHRSSRKAQKGSREPRQAQSDPERARETLKASPRVTLGLNLRVPETGFMLEAAALQCHRFLEGKTHQVL